MDGVEEKIKEKKAERERKMKSKSKIWDQQQTHTIKAKQCYYKKSRTDAKKWNLSYVCDSLIFIKYHSSTA
jgi:hypothetical protein